MAENAVEDAFLKVKDVFPELREATNVEDSPMAQQVAKGRTAQFSRVVMMWRKGARKDEDHWTGHSRPFVGKTKLWTELKLTGRIRRVHSIDNWIKTLVAMKTRADASNPCASKNLTDGR